MAKFQQRVTTSLTVHTQFMLLSNLIDIELIHMCSYCNNTQLGV